MLEYPPRVIRSSDGERNHTACEVCCDEDRVRNREISIAGRRDRREIIVYLRTKERWTPLLIHYVRPKSALVLCGGDHRFDRRLLFIGRRVGYTLVGVARTAVSVSAYPLVPAAKAANFCPLWTRGLGGELP